MGTHTPNYMCPCPVASVAGFCLSKFKEEKEMLLVDELMSNRTCINGRWVIAKPCPEPFWWRVKDAIRVIKGQAEAVYFYKQ
jgi:hypothetical protein